MNRKSVLVLVLFSPVFGSGGWAEEPATKKPDEKKPDATKPDEKKPDEKKPDAAATQKYPVLLLCPDHERYSSWSLYFLVNKKEPTKVLSLGLEELSQLNHKDTGY